LAERFDWVAFLAALFAFEELLLLPGFLLVAISGLPLDVLGFFIPMGFGDGRRLGWFDK
jgi:hypothetical protein